MTINFDPEVAVSHAVPSPPGHEGVHSDTAVHAKRRSRQTATATNKNGSPAGAHKGDLYTHSAADKPLNRENTCPRWDSNCLPGLVNTGKPRKHAESEIVRSQYSPVRSQECGQCSHSFLHFFQPLLSTTLASTQHARTLDDDSANRTDRRPEVAGASGRTAGSGQRVTDAPQGSGTYSLGIQLEKFRLSSLTASGASGRSPTRSAGRKSSS